jgi:hypothetical protein
VTSRAPQLRAHQVHVVLPDPGRRGQIHVRAQHRNRTPTRSDCSSCGSGIQRAIVEIGIGGRHYTSRSGRPGMDPIGPAFPARHDTIPLMRVLMSPTSRQPDGARPSGRHRIVRLRLVFGDLVGYGPDPNEVIGAIHGLPGLLCLIAMRPVASASSLALQLGCRGGGGRTMGICC